MIIKIAQLSILISVRIKLRFALLGKIRIHQIDNPLSKVNNIFLTLTPLETYILINQKSKTRKTGVFGVHIKRKIIAHQKVKESLYKSAIKIY